MRRRSSNSPPAATVTSKAELPCSATPTVAVRCVGPFTSPFTFGVHSAVERHPFAGSRAVQKHAGSRRLRPLPLRQHRGLIGDPTRMIRAVSIRILRQVLLMIFLGVIEL